MAKKEPLKIDLFAMGHTDVADASPWTGDGNGCLHRLLRADALQHRFRSPSRQLDHFPLGLLATTCDEVGGAETVAQGEAALWMHPCRHGCIMACAHHVRQRKDSLE